MPMPAMKTATRCSARTKRTGQRCWNPAAYGMGVCRMHGARKRCTVLLDKAHPNYRHGQRTKEAQKSHKEDMTLLDYVEKLMKRWNK